VDQAVDVGLSAFEFSFKPGWFFTVNVWWPGEIGPNQWFRLAPSFGQDNGFGAKVKIVDEGISLGTHAGFPIAYMTLENLSSKSIDFFGVVNGFINILSAPSTS
jgi:hypothetical protein